MPIIMFVGGNHLQLPAINEAKKLGLSVLVVDGRRDCEAAKNADYMECINVADLSSVERVARTYQIIGTMTMEEDTLPAVCYINEILNLPNQGIGIAQAVTDKYVMRECFIRNRVSCPKFYKIDNEQAYRTVEEIVKQGLRHTPYIVKPTDRRGSMGTTKIESFSQFRAAVNLALKAARNGKVLVEEFIAGEEYGAQGFSIDGEMALCFLSKKTVSANLKTIGHSFPTTLSEPLVSTIQDECRRALESVGVTNGPSTIDIRLDREGMPYILEIGARIGGTRLPQLIEMHSGFEYLAMTIRQACGQKVSVSCLHRIPVAGLLLHFDHPGKVKRIHHYGHLLEQYRPADYRIKIKPNTRISADEFYGYAICKGQNVESAERQCAGFMHDLKQLIEFV